MISSPRTIPPGESHRGFSLLELIVVMAITSIVFGAAAFMISIPNIEKDIREAHSGIENLALRARSLGRLNPQPPADSNVPRKVCREDVLHVVSLGLLGVNAGAVQVVLQDLLILFSKALRSDPLGD